MASRQVGAVTLPLAVAGNPALELCNTSAGWGEDAPREYLASYRHLVVWARELGLVRPAPARRLLSSAAGDPGAAAAALARAKAFRADLYAALTDPRAPADTLARLDVSMRAAAATLRLERSAAGRLALTRGSGSLDGPLYAVADAVRRLVDDDLAGDVGRCPGSGCGWLFLRQGRSRRWCIMSVCGNRAKARRFAERRRAVQIA